MVEVVQSIPVVDAADVIPRKKHRTLNLTTKPYEEFQKLIEELKLDTTMSDEVDRFIVQRIAELKGVPANKYDAVSYAMLKKKYDQACAKVPEYEGKLREAGCFDGFLELTMNDLGYDKNGFSNFEEVTGKLLELAKDNPVHLQNTHLFISLMEAVREKKVLVRSLTDVRGKASPSSSETLISCALELTPEVKVSEAVEEEEKLDEQREDSEDAAESEDTEEDEAE